jgi:hypothetical protein
MLDKSMLTTKESVYESGSRKYRQLSSHHRRVRLADIRYLIHGSRVGLIPPSGTEYLLVPLGPALGRASTRKHGAETRNAFRLGRYPHQKPNM